MNENIFMIRDKSYCIEFCNRENSAFFFLTYFLKQSTLFCN
jgi:hypothetical protein